MSFSFNVNLFTPIHLRLQREIIRNWPNLENGVNEGEIHSVNQ